MEAAQERTALPHLREILKREHDEALEKWGPFLDEEIQDALERERRKPQLQHPENLPTPGKQLQKRGSDMDRD